VRFTMRRRRRAPSIILMLNLAALFVLVWTALSIVAFGVRAIWRLLFGRFAPRRPSASPARARFRRARALAARVLRQRRRIPFRGAMRAISRAVRHRNHLQLTRRIAKWRNISRLHVRIEAS